MADAQRSTDVVAEDDDDSRASFRGAVDGISARQLAVNLWTARDAARAQSDPHALAAVTRDPQLAGDLLHMQIQKCGGAVRSEWHILENVEVFWPGTQDAGWFLAVIESRREHEPARRQRYYLVVEADDRGAWGIVFVAFEADLPPGGAQALDARGDRLTPAATSVLLDDLAENLQSWTDTGTPSASRAWYGGDSYGSMLWNYAQTPPARTIEKTVRISFPAASRSRLVRAPRSDIVCGELLEERILTAPRWRVIHQNDDRHNWGIDIRPGNYASVTRSFRVLTCLRTGDAGRSVEVLALTQLEAGVVTSEGAAGR